MLWCASGWPSAIWTWAGLPPSAQRRPNRGSTWCCAMPSTRGSFPARAYLAEGSQEITTIGALGDNTLPRMKFEELSFGSVCSGPEEIRESARTFIKYGVDHLKINLSGEYIAGLPAEMSPFAEDEVAMLAQEAKRYGKRMAAHARSSEWVKQCVRHGIEMVCHASFADAEALDMLEAAKDRHFCRTGHRLADPHHLQRRRIRDHRGRGHADGLQARTGNCVGLAARNAQAAESASSQAATMALHGCRTAPMPTICSTLSTTSA